MLAWHVYEADECEKADFRRAAIQHLTKAIELAPGDPDLLRRRALVYVQLQEWGRAIADYSKAIHDGIDTPQAWHEQAIAQLTVGDTQGYRETCKGLLARWSEMEIPGLANLVLRTCALGPSARSDARRALRQAEKAAAAQPMNPSYLNTLGTILYRAGRDWEAIRRLQEGMTIQGKGGSSRDWFFLAMANQRLGNTREARSWLQRAVRWTTANCSTDLELELLRGEAKALIHPAARR